MSFFMFFIMIEFVINREYNRKMIKTNNNDYLINKLR